MVAGQPLIELNSHDLRSLIDQLRGERAHARPDLQHHVAWAHLGCAHHALQGLTIDEKDLAQGFLGMQSVGAQDASRLDGKRWHELVGVNVGKGGLGIRRQTRTASL